MLLTKRPAAALAIIALFSIAMLCAESSRSAARRTISIGSRAAEKGRAPAGQRKALKRTVCAEDTAPSSDSILGHWRYLSAKERRVETPAGPQIPVACGIAPLQKVSTKLFLSVLNL
jgi:hypothetical protein